MHKNQRIIIDTRTYVVDEIFERYKRGMLIFYKKGLTTKNRENKITWQVLKALARGIPFPPVYVSELQTGEMLVLDKSDRLRLLMKYLDYGYDNYEEYLKIQEMGYWSERDFLKDIFYSPIFLHVIDYMNPRYMHGSSQPVLVDFRNVHRNAGGRVRNAVRKFLNHVLIESERKTAVPAEAAPIIVIPQCKLDSLVLDITCLGDKVLIS